MKTLLALSASALFLTTACGIGGGGRTIGTGPIVDNERIVEAFDEIDNETSLDLVITQGDVQRVTVSAEADVQAVLKTEVKGDRLTITANGNLNGTSGGEARRILITVAQVENFVNDGSGDASIEGFDADKIQVKLDGSGDFEIRESEFDNVTIDADGSGDIRLDGRGNDLSVKTDGSGDVDAYDWAAEDVVVEAKGSGNVRVRADDKLKVKLSGSGNVYYRGNPNLQLDDTGSGEVKADN